MWVPIKGYEGYYEVSDEGEVRSVDRYVTENRGRYAGKRRFLKGTKMKISRGKGRNNDGYYVVNLHKNGMSNVVPIHILVAEAFIPNVDNLPTVNHIDGHKENNRTTNLEWASYAENNTHALKTGLRSPRGNTILQYSLDGKLVNSYRSACEAARLNGFSRGMISHCLNGRAKTACGYIWVKASESQTTIPTGSTREDELPAEAQRPLI